MSQSLSHISASTAAASPSALDLVNPLSTRTLFWRPRYLHQSNCLHHLPFLFWLSDILRPTGFVSLGVGNGVSYFATCQALDKVNPDALCYGIDTWDQNASESPTIPDEVAKYNEAQYSDFSRLWTGAPETLVRRFSDKSVDLLSVDCDITDELLEGLRHDWVRKLSEKGVVLLHGLHTRFHSPQAQAFLDSIRAAYPSITLDAGDGLLAVLYGGKRDDQLTRLARLKVTDPGYADVHRVFSRLGKAAYEEGKNHAADQRILQAEDKLEKARDALKIAIKTVPDAEEKELRELRSKLAAAEKARDENAEKLEDVVHKKDEIWEKVAERDKKITSLQESNAVQTEVGKKAAADLENQLKVIKITADERGALALKAAKLEAALKAAQAEARKKDPELEKEVARLEAALSAQTETNLSQAETNASQTAQITLLEERITDLCAEKLAVVEEHEATAQSLKDTKKIYKATKNKLSNAKKDRAAAKALRSQLKKEQATVAALRDQLEQEQAAVTEVRDQLEQEQATVTEVRDQLEQEQATVTEVRDQLEQEQATVTKVRDQLEQAQATVTTVHDQLEQEQATIAALRDQLEQAQAAVTASRDQLEQVQAEYDELKETAAQDHKTLTKALEERTSLNHSNDATRAAELAEAKALHDQLEQEQATVTELRDQLEQAQAECDQLKETADQDHKALTKALEERTSQNHGNDKTFATELAEAKAMQHKDRATLTEAMEKTANRLKVATDELGMRKVRMTRLEAQLNSRFRELERLTKAVETDYVLRADFETVQQRNKAIMNSTSWKMTAPARRLMGHSKSDEKT